MDQINTPEYWNKKSDHKGTGGKWGEKGYYFLKDILPQGVFTLLDIGCFKGNGLGYLKPFFPDGKMNGIDFSDKAINVANQKWGQQNLNFEVVDAFQVEGNYDYITLIEVLEHLRDPDKLITRCLSMCNKAIYISVPINNWPCDEHIYAYGDSMNIVTKWNGELIGDIDGRRKIKIEVKK